MSLIETLRGNDFVLYSGLACILWLLWRFIKIIRILMMYFFEPKVNFTKFADGGYALITGGADGIGKAFAYQFAKMGISLYLLDINEKLLLETVADLKLDLPLYNLENSAV